MSIEHLRGKLSFQTKIILAVVTLLILLPALTLAIVHRSSMEALNDQARQALRNADALFQNSFELRSRQLIARYKNIVNDSRFQAVTKLEHPKTMRDHLK